MDMMTDKSDNALLDHVCKSVQDCLASMPVIVLGSGYSCNYGLPGMNDLAEHLCLEVPKHLLEDDHPSWAFFEEKIKQMPLESALQQVNFTQHVIDIIIRETWNLIFPADRKVLERTVEALETFPLSRLFSHLFRSTHQRLSLVTTNYDCLAEYAANIAGYAWATGFGYGYIGDRYGNQNITVSKNQTLLRMVDIWKVHGSLDWYRSEDNTILFLPSVTAPPKGYTPVIVTPGTDKYRQTHEEPFRTIIASADAAIEAGNGFLCVGYGFNDDHLQPKLLEKCWKHEKRIVVLAKELTGAARKVLLDGRCRCFIAFEQSQGGTRVFSPDFIDGIELQGVNLWILDDLLNQVL